MLQFISFDHHVLIVGQQGRKLPDLFRPPQRKCGICWSVTLKQKRHHTSWPSSWPVSYSCWVSSGSNYVQVGETHNLGLVTVVLGPQNAYREPGHGEDLRVACPQSICPSEGHSSSDWPEAPPSPKASSSHAGSPALSSPPPRRCLWRLCCSW